MTELPPSKKTPVELPVNRVLSHQQMLAAIAGEITKTPENLYVQYLPDRCMQAKISVSGLKCSMLQKTPASLVDALRSENFHPESFSHLREECNNTKEVQQYTLLNQGPGCAGHLFVMKAVFGPSFISFWFRNESPLPRIDLPVIHALEILQRLSTKVDDLVTSNSLHSTSFVEGQGVGHNEGQSEGQSEAG